MIPSIDKYQQTAERGEFGEFCARPARLFGHLPVRIQHEANGAESSLASVPVSERAEARLVARGFEKRPRKSDLRLVEVMK